MSTVAATNLKNASSSVNNAVTTSGGDLTNAAGVSFMGGSKNLLYNGACQIAQRNTSVASITTGGYYTADRWYTNIGSLGTWTNSVENDAPTGSGFRKSAKWLCTTADASPSGTDQLNVVQRLEGQDLQRIAKGTSSAQQLTLSFWVKSNVTGTYIAQLFDHDNTRSVSASYTISASATWEKKTITFPADTTGAFDNDNAVSLSVIFWLGAGSSWTSGTLATTWAAETIANNAVGQVNLAAATNNYWQMTGVQLEVGPVATSFEFKSFGQELRECQRYYEKSYNYEVVPGSNANEGAVYGGGISNQVSNLFVTLPMKTPKRANPTTVRFWTTAGTLGSWDYIKASAGGTGAITSYLAGTNNVSAYINVGATWVAASATGHYDISAEL